MLNSLNVRVQRFMSIWHSDGGMLNSLNVRVQRFMSIWHSNKQPRSGTDYTVSRPSP